MSAEAPPIATCRICLASESLTNHLRKLNAVSMKKLVSIYPRLLIDIPNKTASKPSTSICGNCYLSLEISHEFQLKVHNSERLLWEQLTKCATEPVIKPEMIIIDDESNDLISENLEVNALVGTPSEAPALVSSALFCNYDLDLNEIWPCQFCDFRGSSRRSLISHNRQTHLQCHLCGYITKKMFNFKRHYKTQHKTTDIDAIISMDQLESRTDVSKNYNYSPGLEMDFEPLLNVEAEMTVPDEVIDLDKEENELTDNTTVENDTVEPAKKRRKRIPKTDSSYSCPYFPCNYHTTRSYNIKRHMYFVHPEHRAKLPELNPPAKTDITYDPNLIPNEDQKKNSPSDIQPEPTSSCTENVSTDPKQEIAPEYNFYRKTFMCFICKKTFDRSNNYQKHLRTNGCAIWLAKKPELTCEYCGKMFLKPLTRTRHIKNVHLGDDPRLWKCSVCHITMKRRCHLTRHFKCFHPGLDVSYEIVFSSNKNIVTDIPAEVQTFNCQRCTKIFVSRTELRIHLKSAHDTAELFTCDICKKAFKSHREIESHMMVSLREG